MAITSIQKVIKIGSSSGVTIPAKDLKRANISVGDDVEVIIRKTDNSEATRDEVLDTAQDILKRYKQDFDNLAQR